MTVDRDRFRTRVTQLLHDVDHDVVGQRVLGVVDVHGDTGTVHGHGAGQHLEGVQLVACGAGRGLVLLGRRLQGDELDLQRRDLVS